MSRQEKSKLCPRCGVNPRSENHSYCKPCRIKSSMESRANKRVEILRDFENFIVEIAPILDKLNGEDSLKIASGLADLYDKTKGLR